MNYFLTKSDPDTYSLHHLEKDGTTIWDGVHNFQAINSIKKMQIGDLIYVYHSQKEKAIVGLMEVAGEPYENKDDPRKSWAVQVKFVKRYSKTLSLADIRADGRFNSFLLIRNPRLSVMEVPEDVNKFILESVG